MFQHALQLHQEHGGDKDGRKDEPAEGNPSGRGTPGEGGEEDDENYIDALLSSGDEEAPALSPSSSRTHPRAGPH